MKLIGPIGFALVIEQFSRESVRVEMRGYSTLLVSYTGT